MFVSLVWLHLLRLRLRLDTVHVLSNIGLFYPLRAFSIAIVKRSVVLLVLHPFYACVLETQLLAHLPAGIPSRTPSNIALATPHNGPGLTMGTLCKGITKTNRHLVKHKALLAHCKGFGCETLTMSQKRFAFRQVPIGFGDAFAKRSCSTRVSRSAFGLRKMFWDVLSKGKTRFLFCCSENGAKKKNQTTEFFLVKTERFGLILHLCTYKQ